ERTAYQDLAADFAIRIVDRVDIRVEQAVGEVARLRGAQHRGCAPQSAGPRVGRDVGQREKNRGFRAGTCRPVNVGRLKVVGQTGVSNIVTQAAVGIERQRAGTGGGA